MKKYLAFISYKHDDKKYAIWLQQYLESFRLPSYLKEQKSDLPEYVRPIFRDETDLELGILSENIHNALEQSHYLIVICSPKAVKSEYVKDEINYFKKCSSPQRIIPFIIEGEPHSCNPLLECFPDELKDIPELLAANINELGDEYAAVKVIARMLDLSIDELWQRYRIAEDEKKKQLKEERDNLLRIQSYYLSEKSISLYNQGRYDLARRLALFSVPKDKEFNDRPYVPEAENAFRLSYASYKYIFNGAKSCISPDGRWVAVIKGDYSSVIVYSAESGNVIHEFPIEGDPLSIAFSCDSETIACGTRKGYLYMWDITTGICKGELEVGFAIISIAFYPDMEYLVASLKKYDYQSKRIHALNDHNDSLITVSLKHFLFEMEYLLGKFEYAPELQFSPTGRYLVTMEHEKLSVIDTVSKETCMTDRDVKNISWYDNDRYYVYGFGHCIPFVDTEDINNTQIYRHYNVDFASFCGSADKVLAICDDDTVRIWHIPGGKGWIQNDAVLKGHSNHIKWAASNRNGSLVTTCSADDTVRVWSVEDGKCISIAHCERPDKCYFHTDEKFIVIMTHDGLRLWEYKLDIATLKLSGHKEGIISLHHYPDDSKLMTCSSDTEIILWDLNDESKTISVRPEERNRNLISAIFSMDYKYAARLYTNEITLWNTNEDRLVCRHTFDDIWYNGTIILDEKGEGFIISCGIRILYLNFDGCLDEIFAADTALGYNNDDDDEEDGYYNDHEFLKFTSAIAPDLKKGLYACGVKSDYSAHISPICLFDMEGKLHRIIKGHEHDVAFITFNKQRPIMVSASQYGEIKWWNTDNWVCEKTFHIDGKIRKIGFYEDELRLVYEKKDKIIIDNCYTQYEIGDLADINVIEFSDDGSSVFVGCGWPYPKYNEDGELIIMNEDCYTLVIKYRSLNNMIEYVEEQCKNLTFTEEEKKTYHI